MKEYKKSMLIICLIVVAVLIAWNFYSPKEYPVVSGEDLEQLIIITSNEQIDSALKVIVKQ